MGCVCCEKYAHWIRGKIHDDGIGIAICKFMNTGEFRELWKKYWWRLIRT